MNASSQSLESTITRLTSIPARLIGLEKRGQIMSGYFADLVLLSHDFIAQRVWVNGKQVVEDGKLIAQPNVSYGSILRKHT
jgi:N-acetylglucosamine-6-phosphate deacetylase